MENFGCNIRFNLNLGSCINENVTLTNADNTTSVRFINCNDTRLKAPYEASNVDECTNACFAEPGCMAWSYQISTKYCSLFNTEVNTTWINPDRVYSSGSMSARDMGWVSGMRACKGNETTLAAIQQCGTGPLTQTDNCYRDCNGPYIVNGIGRWLSHDSFSISNMTVEFCKSHCKSFGNKYAGLQDHSQCFCGYKLPPLTEKVDMYQCNMPCQGNPQEICGGDCRNSIFAL